MDESYPSIVDEIQVLEADTNEEHGYFCVTIYKKKGKVQIIPELCTHGMQQAIVPSIPRNAVKGCYIAAIQIPTSIH